MKKDKKKVVFFTGSGISAESGIVGTSLTVYPAASLPNYTLATDIFIVDPNAERSPEMPLDVHIIRKTASEGLKEVINSECFKQ